MALRTTLARTLGLLALAAAPAAGVGCDSDEAPSVDEPDPGPSSWEQCQASDAAFVRRVHETVLGRAPASQAHVAALADTFAALRDTQGEAEAKRSLVLLLAKDPGYADRWADVMLDVLSVPRLTKRLDATYQLRREVGCYSTAIDDNSRAEVRRDGGELAAFVRDNAPSSGAPPMPRFRMAELLRSSIVLDDVSPFLRANLFHMMNFLVVGMNVDEEELERIRRLDLAKTFAETYLNRNITCLPCHNSEFSLTYTDDPETNRTWMVPGRLEAALYGDSAAVSRSALEYASVFRVAGVKVDTPSNPWGWDDRCGFFAPPGDDDPLGIDARFGSIASTSAEPRKGLRASVWSLESSLRRGLDRLRGQSAEFGPDVDPDESLAYLASLAVAERVWRETVGTELTIATKFARTEVQRDTLRSLAEAFTRGGYSIQELVVAIVSHPAYNTAAPGASCWESDYPMPPVFNPWSRSDPDPAARGNGPTDRITFRNPRTQLRMLAGALEWPGFEPFPEGADRTFQSQIGVFASSVEPGFRGVDFQARLAWEARFAECRSPGGAPDYVTGLAQRAVAAQSSVEEALMSLRDRMIGQPDIPADERDAWSAVGGVPLEAPLPAESAEQLLRAFCGALASSPQFLLEGLPIETSDAPLRLTPDADGYDARCESLRGLASAAGVDPGLVCAP